MQFKGGMLEVAGSPVDEFGILAAVGAHSWRTGNISRLHTSVVEVRFEESGEAFLLVFADQPGVIWVAILIAKFAHETRGPRG